MFLLVVEGADGCLCIEALLWAGGERSVGVAVKRKRMMHRMTIALAGFLFLSYTGSTQPTSALPARFHRSLARC